MIKTKEEFLAYKEYESVDAPLLCAIGAKICELIEEQKITNDLLREVVKISQESFIREEERYKNRHKIVNY